MNIVKFLEYNRPLYIWYIQLKYYNESKDKCGSNDHINKHLSKILLRVFFTSELTKFIVQSVPRKNVKHFHCRVLLVPLQPHDIRFNTFSCAKSIVVVNRIGSFFPNPIGNFLISKSSLDLIHSMGGNFANLDVCF